MLKFRWIALSLTVVVAFSGCGNKKKEENKTNEVAKPGTIKVTQNAVKSAVKKDQKEEASKQNNGKFYYSYNEEDKSKEAKAIDKYQEDTKNQRTTMDAYLHIRSPYERIKINLMINKLSHDFMVNCSACHDDYGNGIIGPSLLGKDGKFIYGRLMDFKSGKRKNVLMKGLVSQMSDKKLKAIANEIADFNKKLLKLRNGND